MEKTYKRVPFDIELAKKIQSKEIEGRIVTEIGSILHIITFDLKKNGYPILAYSERIDGNINIHFISEIGFQEKLNCCGYVDAVQMSPGFEVIKNDSQLLYIELPEEEPKRIKGGDIVRVISDGAFFGYLGKVIVVYGGTADVLFQTGKELRFNLDELELEPMDELNEPKCEFKVGDTVKCENDDYQNKYKIIEFVKVKGETEIVIQDVELVHMRYLVKKESLTKCENYEKHEFKPFDRVLVRDNDASLWKAGHYSHELDGKHCVSGDYYSQCIPYEGNEHLVGTINNPK